MGVLPGLRWILSSTLLAYFPLVLLKGTPLTGLMLIMVLVPFVVSYYRGLVLPCITIAMIAVNEYINATYQIDCHYLLEIYIEAMWSVGKCNLAHENDRPSKLQTHARIYTSALPAIDEIS